MSQFDCARDFWTTKPYMMQRRGGIVTRKRSRGGPEDMTGIINQSVFFKFENHVRKSGNLFIDDIATTSSQGKTKRIGKWFLMSTIGYSRNVIGPRYKKSCSTKIID